MAHLQHAKIISGTKFEVYDYLTNPANLAGQLNGMIEVKWQNPGVEVQVGSEFLFLMSRFGIEQPIRFVVERMVVGHSLTYRQISGVYTRFQHTIKLEEHGAGDTLVSDFLEYELPFGLFGRIADDFLIRRDLKNILSHRLQKTQAHFESVKNKKTTDMSTPINAENGQST